MVEGDALDAPDHPPAPPTVAEGDTTDAPGSPLAAAATEGWDAPGSAHRHPRRGGRGGGGAVPDHPQRQHAAAEGTPWTCRITLSPAPASVAEGTPWTCRDHHQCPHGTGTPWTPTDSLPPFVRRYDLYFLLRLLRQFPSIKKRPQWADFLVSYINLIIIPVYPDV